MSIRSSTTFLRERFKSTSIYSDSCVYVKNAFEFPFNSDIPLRIYAYIIHGII